MYCPLPNKMQLGIDDLHLLDVRILNLYIEVERQMEMWMDFQEDNRRIFNGVIMPYMLSAVHIL